jgi:hypothetical protein
MAMLDGNHEFRLSAKEREYLKQLATREESLAGLLKFQEGAHGRGVAVLLTRAEAKQLRDYLMTRMDLCFDENYFPNVEGQMLEKLIDKFFIR